MELNVTLQAARERLRLECDLSTLPSVGQDAVAKLNHCLANAYSDLVGKRKWDHLKGTVENGYFDKVTSAGERYYDYPAGLDPDSITNVWYRFGNVWIPLTRGISPDDYTAFDSDADVRSGPAQKWAPHRAEQFELFPIPAENDITVRFEGYASTPRLVNDTDELLLDANLVIYTAAGEWFETRDAKKAAAKKLKARVRLSDIVHRRSSGQGITFNAQPKPDVLDPRFRIRVVQ